MSEVNEGPVVFPMNNINSSSDDKNNNKNNNNKNNNNNNNMYHVPQQSRREKLRYQNTDDPFQIFHQQQQKQQQSPFFSRASHMEPFTGYAAVLEGSRFLVPAQQMLEEMCDIGLLQRGCGGGGGGGDSLNHELVPELQVVDKLALVGYGPNSVAEDGGCGGDEKGRLKAWLISMLDEVYKIYKQYFQQMRAVIASFESIAGLRNAVPFASLAMKSLSKHFCRVKDAIADQLCFTNKALYRDGQSKENIWFGGVMNGSACYGRAPQGPVAIRQQHVWRSQRGLPERAVAVLKAWLFEHFLHPYPTDTDKHMLAKQTGLSRNQVSNWFINARVRLWKPLVEEIHSLEQHQGRKVPLPNNFDRHPRLPPTTFTTHLLTDDKQAPQDMHSAKNQDPPPPGWLRNELSQITSNREVSLSFSDDVSSANHPIGGGNFVPINAGYSCVSLTLGLQQNNGLCIAEPIPPNVAQHFGIGDGSISYITGGSENQDHYIGKDIDGGFPRDFIR